MLVTCTKKFGPFPFAHRQPEHDGHCQLIHGHSWWFEVTFQASSLDSNGFVTDFGKLKEIKSELACKFDHTLVINSLDKELGRFQELQHEGICKLTIVPSASAEGLAHYVALLVDRMIQQFSSGRVTVREVTCFEEDTNSATYIC